MEIKSTLIILTLLLLIGMVSSQEIQINYSSEQTLGTGGGDKWGASGNLGVLQDSSLLTFYGLSGNTDIELTFNFNSTNITRISIIWISGPNNITPQNYSFSFYDLESATWKNPTTWKSTSANQEFETEYNFLLNKQMQSNRIKLFRNGTGAGSGIAIAEIKIFANQTEIIDPEIPEDQVEETSEIRSTRRSTRDTDTTSTISYTANIDSEVQETSLDMVQKDPIELESKGEENKVAPLIITGIIIIGLFLIGILIKKLLF
jgi:hypothetical protein